MKFIEWLKQYKTLKWIVIIWFIAMGIAVYGNHEYTTLGDKLTVMIDIAAAFFLGWILRQRKEMD